MAGLVGRVMAPPPPRLGTDATMSEAVTAMTEARSSCVLIQDRPGALTGIVTERDVTRRISFRASPDDPVGGAMTSPVRTARTDDYLYHAIGAMRRHGLRHPPVLGSDGTVAGMLNLRDALADVSAKTVAQIDRLTHEETTEGLAAVKSAQVEVAAAMTADGAPVADIQSLITHVNNDIYRRITEAAVIGLERDGHGAPPVPFTVIVMGSGGRGENFLYPDQNNGMIVADYPDARHDAVDGYFIRLAERLTGTLDTVGFPLCRGGVMATNPLWRKTLSQWRAQTEMWARRSSIAAVRLADIFFDFAPVYGHAPLAEELRAHVTGLMRHNTGFLREIACDISAYRPALGLFARLVVEKEPGRWRGWVDLKHGGTLPLVGAVRLLALREGVTARATLDRIAALREAGILGVDEADDADVAFRHVTFLLLRQQLESFQAGDAVGNHVRPGRLSRRERRQLVNALRAIGRLQDHMCQELTANILTGSTSA